MIYLPIYLAGFFITPAILGFIVKENDEDIGLIVAITFLWPLYLLLNLPFLVFLLGRRLKGNRHDVP